MTAAAVRAMYRTHPDHPPHSDIMSQCIDACFTCVETCNSCADACLSEKSVANLVNCIRLNLDCADICAATGALASRRAGSNRELLRSAIETCALACHVCAEECERHASRHEHCRVCAQECRRCEEACRAAVRSVH